MLDTLPEQRLCAEPDRMLIMVDAQDLLDTQFMADSAVNLARRLMPKVTGALAFNIPPMHGINFFGIYFPDRRVWFLEHGTRPFTMNRLAGKTIPMWVEDPDGSLRRANPKIKQRTTVDGRLQVLIFRRVAQKGERRRVVRRAAGGGTRIVHVQAHYPGAGGRIARREAHPPLTTAGRVQGRIARGNIGVWWRHPGIHPRMFLNAALTATAIDWGLQPDGVYIADAPTFYPLVRL